MNNQNIFQKISYKIRFRWARVSRSAKVFLLLLVLAGFAGGVMAYVRRPKPVSLSNTALFVYEVLNGHPEIQYGFEDLHYPTILYDNGVFICGSSHVAEKPRQKQLQQEEMESFFIGLQDAGMSDLKSKDYSSESDYIAVADMGTTISAFYAGTRTIASHRSGKIPKQFSQINEYLQSYCDENIDEKLATNTYAARAVRLEQKDQAQGDYRSVSGDDAFANTYINPLFVDAKQTRDIDTAAYDAFIRKLGSEQGIITVNNKHYLVEVLPVLSPYTLAGGQEVEGAATNGHGHGSGTTNKEVLAAATPGVEFIWLHGADQAPPADATTVLNRVSQRTRDWYRSKTGKTMKFSGNRILRSTKTIGQLETCPSDASCAGDKTLAALRNAQKDIYSSLEGRQVLVLYQGTHTSCNGWGGPNSGGYGGGSIDSVATSNGGMGLYNVTGCNWEDGQETLAVHELGHALGSSHWCQSRNIMLTGSCGITRPAGLREVEINNNQKSAFLGSSFFTASNHVLRPGQRLYAGGQLVSANNEWKLVNQTTDGNVVTYYLPKGWYSWNSTTYNPSAPYTIFEFAPDGNVIVSTQTGYFCHTFPKPGADRMVLQDDGNLVVYNAANQALWATSFNYWHC